MNTASTLGTAILRGFYNFLCTGVVASITVYLGIATVVEGSLANAGVSEQDRIVYAVLTGVLSGMGALGFRGGVEGRFDAGRAAKLDQKSSDVGFEPPNPTP